MTARECAVLVVMTGLPATGKSAIADIVAARIAAPCFSVDPLEAALLRHGITREQRSDEVAYAIAYDLAARQLRLGQSAVVDAVNGYPPVQAAWLLLASSASVPVAVIATICSDPVLHRSRLVGRHRDIDGFVYDPTWSDIDEMQTSWYEPFPDPGIVLDACEPLEGNASRAVEYVDTRRG